MKASDLMIGDYFLMNNKCLQISSIQELADVHKLCKGGQKIYPVPITTDILVKNGFEKMPEDKFGRNQYCYAEFLNDIETLDVTIIENKTNQSYNWTINISNPHSFCGRGFINYVHELQHALRLCRIDKEIVLC